MLLDSRLRFAGGAGVDSLLEGALVGSVFVESACDLDLDLSFSFPLLPKKSLALEGCDLGSAFLVVVEEDLGAS